jgi:putative transposase
MPRVKRIIPKEFPLHIMVRGNNRQVIFPEDRDKRYYLDLLLNHKSDHEVDIYHYCLMNNHLHLLLQSRKPDAFSGFMKKVDLSYFFLFKNKYGYVGHLFQNRFKSSIIDHDSYLLQCGKYIELNPVRGGITARPEDYPFSSYRFYAYAFGSKNLLVTLDPLYVALSDSEERRRKLYREFVADSAMISAEKIRNHLYIGSDAFVRKMEETYGLPNAHRPRGRPRKGK